MGNRAESSGISITEEDAALIRGMILRGDRKHDIAAFFGVNPGRIADVESFSRTDPNTSDNRETVCRFGRKRRFVLMLEWLTLWPTWTPLPVTGHLRAMRHLIE